MADTRDQPDKTTEQPTLIEMPDEDELSKLAGEQDAVGQLTEQPNKDLMIIIDEIEGLISQANEKMYDLPIHPVRSTAIEEIDILLRITIKKQLREAFE